MSLSLDSIYFVIHILCRSSCKVGKNKASNAPIKLCHSFQLVVPKVSKVGEITNIWKDPKPPMCSMALDWYSCDDANYSQTTWNKIWPLCSGRTTGENVFFTALTAEWTLSYFSSLISGKYSLDFSPSGSKWIPNIRQFHFAQKYTQGPLLACARLSFSLRWL